MGDFCCTIMEVLLRCVRNCLFDMGKMIELLFFTYYSPLHMRSFVGEY
jgi:hypothetical protein